MSLIALRIKMNNLLPTEAVQVKDGRLVTTSLVVAKVFGKEHKNVMLDIINRECFQKFRELNFNLPSLMTRKINPVLCMI